MKFNPPLEQGLLVKRYKRFLADILTQSGEELTIHCPNTGSMKMCLAPGEPVWYSNSNNPKRKYLHTWELATTPDGDVAGINTHNANTLVKEAIEAGLIPALKNFSQIKAEVKDGTEKSRIDFLVTVPEGEKNAPELGKSEVGAQWYVEVKNVTLKDDGQGCFPDAVSDRGAKHLRELTRLVSEGNNALLVYCVQHSGIESVMPAAHIDEVYAQEFERAVSSGVKVIALQAKLSASEVVLYREIPVVSGTGQVVSY